MQTLYHQSFCPFSRKIRIVLGEKGLPFDMCEEEGFLQLNLAGETPVLLVDGGHELSGSVAIAEYLEEIAPQPRLMGGETAVERAEIRRLVGWFDHKFHDEVGRTLVAEKITKRLRDHRNAPNSALIRSGYQALRRHIHYVDSLAEQGNWLAGPRFSMADVAAAAHLSCVDYIGDIPWESAPAAKEWYARVKSRPSVRPLLADCVPFVPPSKQYADLDF
ncbi:glutathione S-transferase [Alphaproteobacteria bacterium]|nr:glutathione S-transferase [Alphaproteobacteria bacterium]